MLFFNIIKYTFIILCVIFCIIAIAVKIHQKKATPTDKAVKFYDMCAKAELIIIRTAMGSLALGAIVIFIKGLISIL